MRVRTCAWGTLCVHPRTAGPCGRRKLCSGLPCTSPGWAGGLPALPKLLLALC